MRRPPSRSIRKVVGCSSLKVMFYSLSFLYSGAKAFLFLYRAVDISLNIMMVELPLLSWNCVLGRLNDLDCAREVEQVDHNGAGCGAICWTL